MTAKSCFLDPVAQRCADLVNAQLGGKANAYCADDFKGGSDVLSGAEFTLRALVRSISDAVRAWEVAVNSGGPTMEAEKRLLAFKVPHAGDLLDEAFHAAARFHPHDTGIDRLATFHAELAKRHLGVFIDRHLYAAAQD